MDRGWTAVGNWSRCKFSSRPFVVVRVVRVPVASSYAAGGQATRLSGFHLIIIGCISIR